MENKLEQLTRKLYDEGLEKGRAEADRLVSAAKAEAARIVAEAQAKADAVVKQAQERADDTAKNAMTEIALAGRQAVAKIKNEIAEAVVAKSTAAGVKAANLDGSFVKEMLLAVAKNWNGAAGSKVELKALLPEAARAQLDKAMAAASSELLSAGVEVGYSADVKSGFKVAQKEGGYYISFSDDDFNALLGSYLRDKVRDLLFKA